MGSGIEESVFKQMRGQFSDTIPAIFRNTYGKRSGTVGGGGEGTTNVCAFTWRVKLLNCIAISLFVPVSLDDISKQLSGTWKFGVPA